MLRSSVIGVARYTPKFIKSWVQRNPSIYHGFRKAFSFFVGLDGSTATIESGPMQGLQLVVGEHISHAHISGTYELETQLAIERLVSPGFVCYDLGASIGYLSLLMAKKARQVFAFEPSIHAAAEIRKQAAVNRIENIVIVPSPVSDSVRQVRFTVNDNAYGARIAEGQSKWPTSELTTTTLDDFVARNPFPDFIKIDVEDEEARVLQGARSILRQGRTTVCCELHSDKSAREAKEILSEYGYSVMDLQGRPFAISAPVIPGEVQIIASPNGSIPRKDLS